MTATLPILTEQGRFGLCYRSYGLPPTLCDALWGWIRRGTQPGDFLYAVIRNDLSRAVLHADKANSRCLKEWVQFMHSEHVPGMCWGSPEKADAWAAILRGTDSPDLQPRWEPLPYSNGKRHQMADVTGVGRLTVVPLYKGSRKYDGRINGRSVIVEVDTIEEAKDAVTKVARRFLAVKQLGENKS